jgi:hypothetical protein
MSVPICKNCNSELPPYAFSFCPQCGMPVSSSASRRSIVNDRLPRNFYKVFRDIPDKSYEGGGMAISAVRNSMPKNARQLFLKIADNSDTVLSTFKNLIENFDKLPADKKNELLQKITNESKDPALIAFANQLIKNSPEMIQVAMELGKICKEGKLAIANELIKNSPKIAEVAIGFTPLNPYSKVVGKAVEKVVEVRARRKAMGHGLDSFM